MTQPTGYRVMSLIELVNVSKTYRSDGQVLTALYPTDLLIRKGDFICVAGPSGSGKTTLLNLIGGIDVPTSGRVSIGNRSTTGLSRSAAAALRRTTIGFVFQSFNLIPVLTAFENIEYVLMLQGVAARERAERVGKALASVGLAGLADKRPGELSGGQQQRVAVARAIVGRPMIVLADEPTGSLDSKTGEELITLLESINRQHHTTFIFSSHDPRIINRARRILSLHDGRIVKDHTVAGQTEPAQ